MKERIDIAIAIGTEPPASSLVRRHLADWQNVLVAAPSYLAGAWHAADGRRPRRHVFLALPPWHHPADVLTGPGGQQLSAAHQAARDEQQPADDPAADARRLRAVVPCRAGDRRRTGGWPPRARARRLDAAAAQRGCVDAAARDAAGQGPRGRRGAAAPPRAVGRAFGPSVPGNDDVADSSGSV